MCDAIESLEQVYVPCLCLDFFLRGEAVCVWGMGGVGTHARIAVDPPPKFSRDFDLVTPHHIYVILRRSPSMRLVEPRCWRVAARRRERAEHRVAAHSRSRSLTGRLHTAGSRRRRFGFHQVSRHPGQRPWRGLSRIWPQIPCGCRRERKGKRAAWRPARSTQGRSLAARC
jgi:hypothetical protein